ncbi:MAG: HYR domain-containing protein [Bacteroidetes bacterium]|nr:HYR domain-containing protein [Bacteroidota bacterium]
MNRVLHYILCLFLSIPFLLPAQEFVCIPDSSIVSEDGGIIYPLPYDSIHNPLGGIDQIACVGESYEFVFTVFNDTFNFQGNNIVLDSFILNDILGLPEGLDYSCKDNNCVSYFGEYSCLVITGIPNDDPGEYLLEISGTAYVGGFSIQLTFPGDSLLSGAYILQLEDCVDETSLYMDCPNDTIISAYSPEGIVYLWQEPSVVTDCGESISCEFFEIDGYEFIGDFEDHFYYLSNSKASWDEARAMAEEIGGNLVVINDSLENQFLYDRLPEIVHIGISDANAETYFEWVDGAALNYTNWDPTLFLNSEIENYGNFYPFNGKWGLANELVEKRYVIEFECTEQLEGYSLQQTEGPGNGSTLAIGTTTISYEVTDTCGNTVSCSFDITVIPDFYCHSMGMQPWEEWIGRVVFVDIDNTTYKDRYGDYIHLSTNVFAGSEVTIGLTPAFSYYQWEEHFRVWIDYNRDGDFEDENEEVFSGISVPTTPLTNTIPLFGTFMIPDNILNGPTRMRVAMKNGEFPDPCETFQLGEVEDYTLIMYGGIQMMVETNHTDMFFAAYPNEMEVQLNWGSDDKNAEYFLVERSSDGLDFSTLFQIENKRTLHSWTYFQDKDHFPLNGSNFYRIK